MYGSAVYAYNAKQNVIEELPEGGVELKHIELYRVLGTDEYNLTETGDTAGTENNISAVRFKITSNGFESLIQMAGLR